MTALFQVQARQVDFRTQTNVDWLDGLLVWKAGSGGIVPGSGNIGSGSLTIASVDASAVLGSYVVTMTSVGTLSQFTVVSPSGDVVGTGALGTQVYAGGITFTLAGGATAFAVGDAFAISVLPVPVDLTGLTAAMQVRLTATAANIALAAFSAPSDPAVIPTMALGGAAGTLGMRVLQPAMARDQFPPNAYVYDILLTDPATGLTVCAFFGSIEHVDGVSFLP